VLSALVPRVGETLADAEESAAVSDSHGAGHSLEGHASQDTKGDHLTSED